MIDFFILWSLILLSSTFLLNKRTEDFSIFIFFILLLFFIGLRPITLGTDTKQYTDIYQFWKPSLLDSDLEVLFSWYTSFFKMMKVDTEIWFLSLTFVYLFFLFFSIRRIYKENLAVFLLIISNLFFWLFSINILRYGLAFSFVVYSASIFAKKRRKTPSVLFYLIAAAGFHTTIIIQGLALLLFNRRLVDFLFKYYFFLLITSALLFVLNFDLISLFGFFIKNLNGYLPERFVSRFYFYVDGYAANEINIGFSYLVSFFVTVCSGRLRKAICAKVNETRCFFFEVSFYFSLFNLMVLPLVYKFDTFSRVLSGFDFFSVFLMYELICFLLKEKNKRVLFVVFISSLFFFKLVYSGFANNFLSDRFL